MKQELYDQFGKKAIDRMLAKNYLRIVDSASDITDSKRR